MLRTVVLVLANLALAIGLAISVMPVALVVAPVLREEPGLGYAVLAVSTAAFVGMNALLWRGWDRRHRSR